MAGGFATRAPYTGCDVARQRRLGFIAWYGRDAFMHRRANRLSSLRRRVLAVSCFKVAQRVELMRASVSREIPVLAFFPTEFVKSVAVMEVRTRA
jgi:hypothetical protein